MLTPTIAPFDSRRTMAGIHTFVVRTAVKAGMYTLPSRQHFLAGIGEPGASLMSVVGSRLVSGGNGRVGVRVCVKDSGWSASDQMLYVGWSTCRSRSKRTGQDWLQATLTAVCVRLLAVSARCQRHLGCRRDAEKCLPLALFLAHMVFSSAVVKPSTVLQCCVWAVTDAGPILADNIPDSKVHAREFISIAETVSQRATALYGNSKMPRSDSTWTG